TNELGLFEFTQLEYGSYFIKVEKAGLQSDSLLVVLDANNPIVSNISFTINQGQVLSAKENIAENGISIFPNPVSGDLQIIVPSNSKNINIELFSITGQKISIADIDQKKEKGKYLVDFSMLQSGIYVLRISAGETIFVEKITKL
ncbi:MAG: T9SS type A sorting domain-containing protein, partial [Bacteroidota bacterium]|nr:T9SS type A sorting domain-containing protein [Bacteroidota bacterium]